MNDDIHMHTDDYLDALLTSQYLTHRLIEKCTIQAEHDRRAAFANNDLSIADRNIKYHTYTQLIEEIRELEQKWNATRIKINHRFPWYSTHQG
jgi:hypothetical protein